MGISESCHVSADIKIHPKVSSCFFTNVGMSQNIHWNLNFSIMKDLCILKLIILSLIMLQIIYAHKTLKFEA